MGDLLQGDSKAAKAAATEHLNTFAPADAAKRKASGESVMRSNPLKPGGSTSAVSQRTFLDWARAALPANDVDRILKLAQTYSKTADRRQLLDSHSMNASTQLSSYLGLRNQYSIRLYGWRKSTFRSERSASLWKNFGRCSGWSQ